MSENTSYSPKKLTLRARTKFVVNEGSSQSNKLSNATNLPYTGTSSHLTTRQMDVVPFQIIWYNPFSDVAPSTDAHAAVQFPFIYHDVQGNLCCSAQVHYIDSLLAECEDMIEEHNH